METKYIFVTGGVVSSLGKGIISASIGKLLQARGYKVTIQKFDPYINIDPGTLNPYEHGECYVTVDGMETDLDLGHYERFTGIKTTRDNSITTGRIYKTVIDRERQGDYLGKTIQVVPHITDEIKRRMLRQGDFDFVITEVGGTIGDIESAPFMEAIRQIRWELGRNAVCVHLTYVPYLKAAGELKTKPTQHSVKELQAMGIHPDIIVTRSDKDVGKDIRKKISMFCNVAEDCVISNTTLDCLYEVPIMLHNAGMDEVACRELGISLPKADMREWQDMVDAVRARSGEVNIALVGKYVKLHDSYLSIVEALNHASFVVGKKVKIKWVESDKLTEENAAEIFKDCAGIIVPGGFGDRGIEGMIVACKYARENKIPYFGICLGMQICVIEYARHVLGFQDANSREFNEKSTHLVIDLMPDQQGVIKGGTMRLGAYPCKVKEGTTLYDCYGEPLIKERHRHRYEFNNEFKDDFEKGGLTLSGTSPSGHIVETVELTDRDFYVGVQFHPEFKSRPNKPHPLFVKFVSAAAKKA